MSMSSQQYAALAYDAYSKPRETGEDSSPVNIGGASYKRLDYIDRPSGYQGVLYQRVDTRELIVVHRGTEFHRQPLRDGLYADSGMIAKLEQAGFDNRSSGLDARNPLGTAEA
ncbi:hypothetical protein XTPLMG728_0786 [Xanthomonas translucens pv. poae]|uniref:Uncharacterized protein n=1 Tax=Xanthomonas graminis pv. poae TaxID=227946 RepID=A0A0K2ZHL6_9XANT|nr:hypothetical protein KM539_08670 [Xanthomonas translucens pv. poae]CTP85148.1 hypothetical protein XTPLMG728_0786 [Xanthomonas translucens pv. poae]